MTCTWATSYGQRYHVLGFGAYVQMKNIAPVYLVQRDLWMQYFEGSTLMVFEYLAILRLLPQGILLTSIHAYGFVIHVSRNI